MDASSNGIHVDILMDGVRLTKHVDTMNNNRTYVIGSPDREYTIQVCSAWQDCLATARVEGTRVLCKDEDFLPVWRGKSRTFHGFETERVMLPVEEGQAMQQSTTRRPLVFVVPEGHEDAEPSVTRCVEVELFEAVKELVPWRPPRGSCVHSRADEPSRPILASHERKNYEVSGEEPIATRAGDPVTATSRRGSGFQLVNHRRMKEKLAKGPSIGRIVIHYVGPDQANRLRPLPEEPRPPAALSWAGAFGAMPAADLADRPRVVVDAPNVARYFATAAEWNGTRPPALDPFVLEGVLDDMTQQAPHALMLLVFSISSAANINAGQLRERHPGRLTLRCCQHGEDVDAVVLREAAAPGSRGCILSNDRFVDYVDRGVVSENWLSRYRVGFEIRGDETTFRPPAPHIGLAEFLAALPSQGQVLGSSASSAPPHHSAATEVQPAREPPAEGEDEAPGGPVGVEEYALQRALERSMNELQLHEEDLDRAIAASLQELQDLEEEVPEEVYELGGLVASEEAQLRWALEASLRQPQPVPECS